MTETGDENQSSTIEPTSETGAPHHVGGFRYHRHDDRWEWSDAVAHMHGYSPGTITPNTDLILTHKHPDDRAHVAHTLDAIRTAGGPFSSRHRILDTTGTIHSVIVVGDSTINHNGDITGSSGFYIDVTDTLESTIADTVDHIAADLHHSRAAIEQAKGMLMVIYNIPADRAFDILVWRSQETNVKLRDLAAQLLDRAATFQLPLPLRTEFDHILLGT
ncbi:PAS and ANTAR domain-containing protein [Rhodococcus erythropolis]|uniref:PAS and ANTAR domain-containing protein n=1 Tax=Rhodococcus erythropolis TaxID=1833 RepID=UPI001BE9090B|nr:PAS and ANTAR domain-containing protein [Rhodococcus erythropolis]MBT2266000.1 PAS and ANTAR domain-containing protein [Rhodococcus erythropolis]